MAVLPRGARAQSQLRIVAFGIARGKKGRSLIRGPKIPAARRKMKALFIIFRCRELRAMHSAVWQILLALAILCTFGAQLGAAMATTPEMQRARADQATATRERFKRLAEQAQQRLG